MSNAKWRRRLLCAALCAALSLPMGGCVGGVDVLNKDAGVTLPPTETRYAAPT